VSDKSAARTFARKLIRSWLAAVDRVQTYTPVRDPAELPAEALASSGFWCASFFPSCADPHEPALAARASVHLAWYKRVSQFVGFWNEREWFDEEFRAKQQR
jgi:hypothetical protein